jgi:hypothetical protein
LAFEIKIVYFSSNLKKRESKAAASMAPVIDLSSGGDKSRRSLNTLNTLTTLALPQMQLSKDTETYTSPLSLLNKQIPNKQSLIVKVFLSHIYYYINIFKKL